MVLPTSYRATYLFSHRATFHVIMVLLIVFTMFVNLMSRGVRAETYGQESYLFAMVSADDSQVVETIVSDESTNRSAPVSYFQDVLFGGPHVDTEDLEENYFTTTVGGAVASPLIHEASPTIAVRTDVESYTVQDGDSLGKIASSYGLSLNTILWANRLTFRSTIRPGQELQVRQWME